MSPVEIEQAVSALAAEPFDAESFPFAFLEAFGNKATTIKRLRSGNSNQSDLENGVLQRSNIHIATVAGSQVSDTLSALRESSATTKQKAKFILATDGVTLEAESLADGETLACDYAHFSDHFGFFLPLAGITTVKEIRDNAFDMKATSRLNKLYIELLKDNPDWGTADLSHDMNHFMARLIFCFFAEDTDIFDGENLFTTTVEKMSVRDSSDTHEIISEIFRAMNTKPVVRQKEQIKRWALDFPYVNGGLFSGSVEVPHFSKIARSYLLHVGNLDWTKINPDIFGSMIQAVADDEERGSLGMHYTSVPNILKVLNPLFLDELREKLAESVDNPRKLLNLRRRIAHIRVFDPACGSGNFLVIAYKELRVIEAEINLRRNERDRRSDIPLTSFRGIELRPFAAEIARLALIIAEYQCDVLYRGQKEALKEFLPLDQNNWITCGNALRLDWLSVCPPTGKGVKLHADDLLHEPLDQSEIDFENEGGETYICGNPPYKGGKKQNSEQKEDMKFVFGNKFPYKNLDYISAFFLKGANYLNSSDSLAFVSTSSINQGSHVPTLWPRLLLSGINISFTHRPFKWANNAASNAGVYVTIVGFSKVASTQVKIFDGKEAMEVQNINCYLIPSSNVIVKKSSAPISKVAKPITGNAAYDQQHLRISNEERDELFKVAPNLAASIVRPASGTAEFMSGKQMWCLWIDDGFLKKAITIPLIAKKIAAVNEYRSNGGEVARALQNRSHQFRFRNEAHFSQLIIPQVIGNIHNYIPVGLLEKQYIITHLAHVMYDADLYNLALLSSRLHSSWAITVSGRHGNGLRYSSNLGWNTFPVPNLTEKNKADLTRCAEDILLAREAHFPATIADLYKPESMPENLRQAHQRNDETLERIYIGRCFKNDTERLEKLFELYTKMTS